MTSIQYSPHNRFVCLVCHEMIDTGTILVSHNDVLTWHVDCFINLNQLQGFSSLRPTDQDALSSLSIPPPPQQPPPFQEQQQQTIKIEPTSITSMRPGESSRHIRPEQPQHQSHHHYIVLTRRVRQFLNQQKCDSTHFRCKIVGRHYSTIGTHPSQIVTLICEPSNPYDSNAIRVNANNNPSNLFGDNTDKIGYIERDLAAQLQPILRLVSRPVHAIVSDGLEDGYKIWAEVDFQSIWMQNNHITTTASHYHDQDHQSHHKSCCARPISADPTILPTEIVSTAGIKRENMTDATTVVPPLSTTTSKLAPSLSATAIIKSPRPKTEKMKTTRATCTQFEGNDDDFYNLLSLPVVSSRKHELVDRDEDSSSTSSSASNSSTGNNNNRIDHDCDFRCHKKSKTKPHSSRQNRQLMVGTTTLRSGT